MLLQTTRGRPHPDDLGDAGGLFGYVGRRRYIQCSAQSWIE